MRESDVVLCPFLIADGTFKHRPAIILREMCPFGDLLLCGVSTQLRHEVKDFDEIIALGDDDFTQSGLLKTSLIRLGYLALIPQDRIVGVIGEISKTRHRRLLKNLSAYLMENV